MHPYAGHPLHLFNNSLDSRRIVVRFYRHWFMVYVLSDDSPSRIARDPNKALGPPINIQEGAWYAFVFLYHHVDATRVRACSFAAGRLFMPPASGSRLSQWERAMDIMQTIM